VYGSASPANCGSDTTIQINQPLEACFSLSRSAIILPACALIPVSVPAQQQRIKTEFIHGHTRWSNPGYEYLFYTIKFITSFYAYICNYRIWPIYMDCGTTCRQELIGSLRLQLISPREWSNPFLRPGISSGQRVSNCFHTKRKMNVTQIQLQALAGRKIKTMG